MSNIEGLSKGVKLVSIEFNTAVKYVTRNGFVNDFPITFDYQYKDYLRVLVGFQQRDDYTILKVGGIDCVRFNKDLVEGVSVTIRHITPSGAVPHIYQYNSNAQGGAEFSAKTIDENFEYMSKIVSEVEDYNSIAQGNLNGMEEKFEETQDIANEAIQAATEAKDTADNAEQVALGIDGKAQEALDNSVEALGAANDAKTTALGIDGKAQEALDKSTTASQDASNALNIAQGIDGKVQTALDNSSEALGTANTALTVAQGVDVKAQTALDNSELALENINNKRDLDDNDFNGYLQVRSENEGQGTGVFLQDTDGTVRGQVVATDQGLQLTQYPQYGDMQNFTMPNRGGSLALTQDLSFVTPQMYGAKADGVSDDAPAINEALKYNSRVVLPRGNYLLKTPVIIDKNYRTIEGATTGGTNILSQVGSGGSIVLDGMFNTLKNINLICNVVNTHTDGVHITKQHSSLLGVKVTHGGGDFRFRHCVYVPSGSSPWVHYSDNCTYSISEKDAFKVDSSGFNHASFNHVSFVSAGDAGFHLNAGSSHVINFNGCRAEDCSGYGFKFIGLSGNQAFFDNVYLEHCGGGIAAGYGSSGSGMESIYIDSISAWELDGYALIVEDVKSADVGSITVGSSTPGHFENGAVRSGSRAVTYINTRIGSIRRRGADSSFPLIYPGNNKLIIGNQVNDNMCFVSTGNTGVKLRSVRFDDTGKCALFDVNSSDEVDLTNIRSDGVTYSINTSKNIIAGKSSHTSINSSSGVDLSKLPESSTLISISASNEVGTSQESVLRATVLSSVGVVPKSNTVLGGYASSGDPAYSNTKWELSSTSGDLKLAGQVTTTNNFADYAEMFENLHNSEIPLGTIVTLEDGKVRPTIVGDEFILGVVSATAAIVSDDSPFHWQGKYLTDEYGRLLTEDVVDPGTGEIVTVRKTNPEFDPSRPYSSRSSRKEEWTTVGLLGKVYVNVSTDVKSNDYVDALGNPSASPTKLRCLQVTAVKGEYNIARCLII